MPVCARCSGTHGKGLSGRFGIAVLAVGVGIVFASAHDAAWADAGSPDSSAGSAVHAGPAQKAADRLAAHRADAGKSGTDLETPDVARETTRGRRGAVGGNAGKTGATVGAAAPVDSGTATTKPPVGPPDPVGPQTPPMWSGPMLPTPVSTRAAAAQASEGATSTALVRQAATAFVGEPGNDATAFGAVVTTTTATTTAAATTTTTPHVPAPLSPLAQLLELPGQIVNAVLQLFDLTVAVNGYKSPIDFAPVAEMMFAAFRRVENILGLDEAPAVQQVLPTLTYTGPTTAATPTVAQFLNAAGAEYVLGGTPGGMQPLTVNGFQLAYANIFSGASAKVWVTPEQQIIIAYQGTTGGTNLLLRPLMAAAQLLTDLQVIFTETTPQAFVDSLNFARLVQGEAAKQGYEAGDIFVTGHSLGGWEAEYVAQQLGLAGIGFESPGINTKAAGNGADSMFVNVETYGDTAAYFSTDLPGLQPFMPAYQPGGGSKPHYGPIVMIGDPRAVWPVQAVSTLWGKSLVGAVIFLIDIMANFFQYHLPGVQAYHLGVAPDPGVVPWLGSRRGDVHTGYGELTIPQLLQQASDDGILVAP